MIRRSAPSATISGRASVGIVVAVLIVVAIAGIALWQYERSHRVIADYYNCPDQLRLIGLAMKSYVEDWDDRYPTNRLWLASGKLGQISNSVPLSMPGSGSNGLPIRFEHGIAWVEALIRYDGGYIAVGPERYSEWRCPVLREKNPARTSKTAAVTYAFNRNLIERFGKDVRFPKTLMMVREIDRLVDSDLRPVNESTSPNQPPQSAFLTRTDSVFGQTDPDIHDGYPTAGSCILFADGHAKWFPTRILPAKCVWSPKFRTWGNAEGTISVSP